MRCTQAAHRSTSRGTSREGALYPDGAYITDPKQARDLLYKMQRPAIALGVRLFFVFLVLPDDNPRTAAHSWCVQKEKDLVLFHNRDVLHTVVGAFKSDQVRAFYQ